jgi:pimeloyl-ACP methyl ester carboxylesterase
MIGSLLTGAVLVYGGFCAVLFLFQERLIFVRQPLPADTIALVHRLHPDAEEFRVKVADGVSVHGWFRHGPVSGRSPLLIYFGGNAEEVSWIMEDLGRHPRLAAAMINYRGYGLSDGSPSEATLTADAVAIYDALVVRPDVDPDRVILMGRSLGSGVAVYLATQRPVRGLVLVSPYDSLTGVAQSLYPAFPVSALIRHRFDSLSRAPTLATPLLALGGTADTLVKAERSRTLVAAWKGHARFEALEGADHGDIMLHPQFWPKVNAFLDELLGAPVPQGR